MTKHLLLIFAFFASINVSAQEQSNALLNRLLDKVQQLQNEVTELRNQNELTQFELKKLQKNLDQRWSELETQIDRVHTTPTMAPASTEVVPNETQLEQLKNNSQELELQITKTNSRLDELARIVEEMQLQTLEVPAIELENNSQELELQITKTNNRLDELARIVEEMQLQTLEVPAGEPEVPAGEPEVPAGEPEVPAGEPEVPEEKPSLIEPVELPDEDEYAAYSKAMGALDRADYTRLRDNLIRFLQDYPEGDYADDANYWVAESYYAEGDLEQATLYFTQLIENYADSEKREPALLKIAYIRLNKEQWEDARKILERLKNEAEDEQIRQLAIEQLEQLGNEGR